jgi:isopentenyl phosphate kinase
MSVALIKLGGSVITDKSRYRTFNQESTDRLAREIASSGRQVILVHGAGSFGHLLAHEHQLQRGYLNDSQRLGLVKVQQDVRDLNREVMFSLDRAGITATSIPPGACAVMEGGRLKKMGVDIFHRYLELGITPVTFGDVVLDTQRKFGICSGDQLMLLLAREFHPNLIVFCADVDGIFTADPNLDKNASLIEQVDSSTLESLPRTSRVTDVTGSIYGKLESMLSLAQMGKSTMVINGLIPGRLASALRGEKVKGSMVVGGRE